VRAGLAFSTDYANPGAAIIALFDNGQAMVGTDRSPRPIVLHRSLQLDAERGRKQRIRLASLVGPVARMRYPFEQFTKVEDVASVHFAKRGSSVEMQAA
jgi:hypothetical protein